MAENAFEQIQRMARRVKKLNDALKSIAESTRPCSWWTNTGLDGDLQKIIDSLDKTYGELCNPCLKIAFVGTTSSGKSTLLNGLSGHRVAPMEAGEMSAGVVRIRDDRNMSMRVLETPNMAWQAGNYEVRSDEDIYSALRDKDTGIMDRYRKAVTENNEVKAPQIEITLPLAPKNGGVPRFSMPAELGLELYDLPGLKNNNDAKNLAVIQQYLAGSFLLVVLNYSETDTDKRAKLLTEIKRIVQSVCKNTEALMFVLNRIDERNSGDNPLEVRIAELKRDIKDKLELKKEPEIIPMSALPLYHVQGAWGAEATPLYAKDDSDRRKSMEHLKGFFEDCPKIIKSIGKEDGDKKQWFKNHDEDNITEPDAWDADDIPQLLGWVYEYSGATRFWEKLQSKLAEQIGAIIINPALGETVSALEEFSQRLSGKNGLLETLQLSSEEAIQQKREEVEKLANGIKKKLGNFKTKFGKDFSESVKACREQDETALARTDYGKRFISIIQVLVEIVQDVRETVMLPIRDALLDGDKLALLEQVLGDSVPKELARSIVWAVIRLIQNGYLLEDAQKGRELECRADEEAKYQGAIDKIKLLNKSWEHLAGFVGKALLARSQFLLQEKLNFFGERTEEILHASMSGLAEELKKELGKENVEGLLSPVTLQKKREITLPYKVFDIITVEDIARRIKKTVTERTVLKGG
ncbi:dynamin family protein [Breznakiellaceae bacterium SP9]